MIDSIKKPAIRMIVEALRQSKPAQTPEAKARHAQALAYAEALLASMGEAEGVQ